MPLFVDGKILVNGQEYADINTPASNTVQKVFTTTGSRNLVVEKKVSYPISDKSSPHHVLIVDGKEKKLSKKSAYLLDMMTIEEL